jgi:hypothetical protein
MVWRIAVGVAAAAIVLDQLYIAVELASGDRPPAYSTSLLSRYAHNYLLLVPWAVLGLAALMSHWRPSYADTETAAPNPIRAWLDAPTWGGAKDLLFRDRRKLAALR